MGVVVLIHVGDHGRFRHDVPSKVRNQQRVRPIRVALAGEPIRHRRI
jgi:hypothetical protein